MPERGPGTETGQQGPCSPQACALCGTPRTAGSCDGRKCLVSLSLVGHAVLSTHAAAALPQAAPWGRPRCWFPCVSPFVVLSTPGDSDTQTNAENCGKETGGRLRFGKSRQQHTRAFIPSSPGLGLSRNPQESPVIPSFSHNIDISENFKSNIFALYLKCPQWAQQLRKLHREF